MMPKFIQSKKISNDQELIQSDSKFIYKCLVYILYRTQKIINKYNRYAMTTFPQYFYTDRSKAVLLLWFLNVLAVCVYTLVHLLC